MRSVVIMAMQWQIWERVRLVWLFGLVWIVGCGSTPETEVLSAKVESGAQAILLITLDTTRADRLGFEGGPSTPALDKLAAQAIIYRRAYTTAPTTLPAHVSMMTGLYPYQHGIHENARYLPAAIPTLAQRLVEANYSSAAFVSGYPLAASFGIARGFEFYDEPATGKTERPAAETTDRALRFLSTSQAEKLFLWVHYYDPHAPYSPPADLAKAYSEDAYQGEIASMDRELGRLVAAFQQGFATRSHRILVVGDHGEGLGEGGEAQHGHLLSEGVMRVPMLLAGSGVQPGEETRIFSTRKIFDVVLGLAGLATPAHIPQESIILAEAMKPFLQYGWAPQTLALSDGWKAIRTDELAIFDLANDPNGENDLFGKVPVPEALLQALKEYSLPKTLGESVPLSEEEAAQLASLGYAASQGLSVLREGIAKPAEMVHLLPALDRASQAFANGKYPQAAAEFRALAEKDPNNLMVQLRLAVAYSQIGARENAEHHFVKSGQISPDSVDVRHYLAMHYLRFKAVDQASEQLHWVLERQPNRLTALKALANLAEQQGQLPAAMALWVRAASISGEGAIHLRTAMLAMQLRDSQTAATHFAIAAAAPDIQFQHYLEWGVCLLDLRQLDEAVAPLEAVPSHHPGFAMALFKRAQVAALRGDADVALWVGKAWQLNHPQIRQLIKQDGLLRDQLPLAALPE